MLGSLVVALRLDFTAGIQPGNGAAPHVIATSSVNGKNVSDSIPHLNVHPVGPSTPLGSTCLKNIYLSHGSMDPPAIQKDVMNYVVTIDQPVNQVAIIPELDRSGFIMDNVSERDMPIVRMDYEGELGDETPESSAFALRKQIILPQDGRDLPVNIRIQSPHDNLPSTNYQLTFKQSHAAPAALKSIEGTEDTGRTIVTTPVLGDDAHILDVYVSPKARYVDFTLICTQGALLKVNGKDARSGSAVRINRNSNRHNQLVEVSCARVASAGAVPAEMRYSLLLKSDFPLEQLTPPSLSIASVGKDCRFNADHQHYDCPDEVKVGNKIQVISRNDPTIKYVLSDGSGLEVRVLNGQLSIPFTASTALKLTAYSGQNQTSWPLNFTLLYSFSLFRISGWIIAVVLGTLLLSLFVIVGFTNINALGVPLGSTEIAATMTFIIQYLCFANSMRGSIALNEFIAPVKWVTLFWPLPWQEDQSITTHNNSRKLMALGSRGYGIALWGDHSLGDVTDIRNAVGCLFWSSALIAVFMFLHAFVITKFKVWDGKFTFPHRIRFGNWESRCLHWIVFPTFAGAAAILTTKMATLTSKALAVAVMCFYAVWIIAAFVEIAQAVSQEKVVWLWNNSLREDGELEDESGYWADAYNDQLLTQPVNRSLCRGFFPYRWISTVADITPVAVTQLLPRNNGAVYPPDLYAKANDSIMVSSKTPQIVEVIKSRAPNGLCAGQRLVAGLLRSQWLDFLFTYEVLTKFHSLIDRHGEGNVSIPLVVKTSQLSGPITSGRQAFFFDGARIPFIRIADFVYKMIVGVLVGVALASEGHKADLATFTTLSVISTIFLVYVAYHRPYSRVKENWMVVFLLLTVTLSAASFATVAVIKNRQSIMADCCLWLVAICCVILAAYSCVVTFSLFSAIVCPPLEESRFLERMANCVVTVSDPYSRWYMDVPAYSKYPIKNMQARCTQTGRKRLHFTIHASRQDSSLELSVADVQKACATGELTLPSTTLFMFDPESELGYKYLQLTSSRTHEHEAKIVTFLKSYQEPFDDAVCCEIARRLMEHIGHGRRQHDSILCITLILNKSN